MRKVKIPRSSSFSIRAHSFTASMPRRKLPQACIGRGSRSLPHPPIKERCPTCFIIRHDGRRPKAPQDRKIRGCIDLTAPLSSSSLTPVPPTSLPPCLLPRPCLCMLTSFTSSYIARQQASKADVRNTSRVTSIALRSDREQASLES